MSNFDVFVQFAWDPVTQIKSLNLFGTCIMLYLTGLQQVIIQKKQEEPCFPSQKFDHL